MNDRPSRPARHSRLAPAALLAVALLASACGNSTPDATSPSQIRAGAFGVSENPAIAAEVPKAIASKGSVTVASDATYPPMESITPGTTMIVGADPDLGHAIGIVLGLKFNFQNVTFNKILLGLKSGQYDLGMSSFTDEKSREKVVEFTDYFKAGTSFVVPASSSQHLTNLSQICGMTVAVETAGSVGSWASSVIVRSRPSTSKRRWPQSPGPAFCSTGWPVAHVVKANQVASEDELATHRSTCIGRLQTAVLGVPGGRTDNVTGGW